MKSREKSFDPIKHVVLLMMENQSFDRKLGDVKKVKPDLEGVDSAKPNFNFDNKGTKIFQQETRACQMPWDPMHEVPDVHQQLGGENGGFIQNFILHYPKSSAEDRQGIMAFYPNGFLPALHVLAAEYTVCDHWFASVPGPTWTNRFFALSGTSNGRVKMLDNASDLKNIPELFFQTQPNIFDRLDERNVSWRCYSGDFPISLVLTHNREPQKLLNYKDMEHFFEDAKRPAHLFPEFAFIEPKYLNRDQNDDHPPHNTMKAEKLIADVYNALRANEELWESILFVVVYDEHGGFYDHVIPPQAVAPDHHHEEGFNFEQLGLRVPAILISPWAKKPLDHTVFDHTSLLKYLLEKWELAPLGQRTSHANSIREALDFEGEPRKNCLSHILVPEAHLVSPDPHLEKHAVNENHATIHAFADYLDHLNEVHTVHQKPTLCKAAELKEKIGSNLERLGLLKVGEWLREEANEHHQLQIERTLSIVRNKLTMFQPHARPKEGGGSLQYDAAYRKA